MAHKTVLLCVDMQNDFCLPEAVLCVKGAMRCLPKVIEAVDVARSHGVPVIWVIREHHPSGVDVERYREHLYDADRGTGATVSGRPGAALVAGLSAAPGELIISKKRFSAFMHTHLDSLLRRMGAQAVAVCGVQTPNCIRGTAWDAIALDYPQVTVLADATASASDEVQAANLGDLRAVGVGTPSVGEWAAGLAARGAAGRPLCHGL